VKQILIVAATAQELLPTFNQYHIHFKESETFYSIQVKHLEIFFLITGVGMVNTAFALGKISTMQFDVVINAGIAGTFEDVKDLGEVVLVVKDELAEMGAENGEEFIKYQDLNLPGVNIYHPKYHQQFKLINQLKKVNAITVNKVHGKKETIDKCKLLFDSEIESMEGAAFFMGAQNLAAIVIQLRSISNRIEIRDKSKWQIPLAIKNLNAVLIKLIESF